MPGGSRMTRRSQGRPNIPHLHEATIGCQNVVLANRKLLHGFPILLSPYLGFSLHTLLHVTYTVYISELVIDVSKKYLSQPQPKNNPTPRSQPQPPSPTPQLAKALASHRLDSSFGPPLWALWCHWQTRRGQLSLRELISLRSKQPGFSNIANGINGDFLTEIHRIGVEWWISLCEKKIEVPKQANYSWCDMMCIRYIL